MKDKKIWVHTLVFNEENFIWFAVKSVIGYVDKILIWDTGSTDSTVRIIKELIKKYPNKIEFKEIGPVNNEGVTIARQEMLAQSVCDWIIFLDGDEIWPESSIKKVISTINSKGGKLDALVVPYFVLLGDIYHYQQEEAGQYKILGRKGHLQIRAFRRNINGLHIKGTYPLEGLYNNEGKLLQDSGNLFFVQTPYFHATHLKRSSKGNKKFKYELGIIFSSNLKLPEVFSMNYPSIVPSPWVKREWVYEILAFIRAPAIFLKRRIFLK